jgi:hypothetical protein
MEKIDEKSFEEYKAGEKSAREILEEEGVKISTISQKTDRDVSEVLEKDYIVENYSADEINDNLIKKVADVFRQVFVNGKEHLWKEYAFCPNCVSKDGGNITMSAQDVYQKDPHEEIPISYIDANPIIPDCPNCHRKMQLYYDPKKTFEILKRRLSHDAWLGCLVNSKNRLVGIIYGYLRTLREIFDEEWKKYFPFADIAENKNPQRNFNNFIKLITESAKTHFGEELDAESKMMVLNCIAITKEARGKNKSMDLTTGIFNTIPRELIDTKLLICEAKVGNLAHAGFKFLGGAQEIKGIYNENEDPNSLPEEGDYVIMIARLSRFNEAFNKKHMM